MSFEKERIITELRKNGRIAISKLSKYLKIPYYKLKFEFIPELEKDNIIRVVKEDRYVYIELIERRLDKND